MSHQDNLSKSSPGATQAPFTSRYSTHTKGSTFQKAAAKKSEPASPKPQPSASLGASGGRKSKFLGLLVLNETRLSLFC